MLSKIKDYGISLTQANLPQVVVKFETEKGQAVTWWGSLKEGKAREITIKALMTMGFAGEDLAPLAPGIAGGALNHVQEYDLTVETKPDQNGKNQTRVAWINLPGQSAIQGKLEEADALNALKGLNIKGDILAVKQSLPSMPHQATGTDGDIPF